MTLKAFMKTSKSITFNASCRLCVELIHTPITHANVKFIVAHNEAADVGAAVDTATYITLTTFLITTLYTHVYFYRHTQHVSHSQYTHVHFVWRTLDSSGNDKAISNAVMRLFATEW